MHLVVNIPQSVLHQSIIQLHLPERRLLASALQVVRHAAHVLHSASHNRFLLAQLDLLSSDTNSFHPAGAHLVDRRSFCRRRQAGEHTRLPCRSLPDSTGKDVSHVDMADLFIGDGGAGEGFFDCCGAQLSG